MSLVHMKKKMKKKKKLKVLGRKEGEISSTGGET